jgi:hypothetical protein
LIMDCIFVSHSQLLCLAPSNRGLIIGVSIVVGFVIGVLTATNGIDEAAYLASLGEGANPNVGVYQLRSIAERQNMHHHQEL